MLGLPDQIRGDNFRVGGVVRNYQNFRRAGEHVDADAAVENALGLRHVLISRTDQNVGAMSGEQAERQRGNALHAAEIEDGVGARRDRAHKAPPD